MFWIIVIAVIALYVFYKKTHYNDPPALKELFKTTKGITDEQKASLRYFLNDPACLSKKPITDEEYDAMVINVLNSENWKQKALNKIGLDEDQLKEIEPVQFEGYVFENAYSKKSDKDDLWRSSRYQISWLFFSATQLYAYQYTFNMDNFDKKEQTLEYFYKDVTNFATSSDTEETEVWNKKAKKFMKEKINSNRFTIVVPGDKFYCSLKQNDETERAIQGMKALLREKKNA
jgi:hypothetical protein